MFDNTGTTSLLNQDLVAIKQQRQPYEPPLISNYPTTKHTLANINLGSDMGLLSS